MISSMHQILSTFLSFSNKSICISKPNQLANYKKQTLIKLPNIKKIIRNSNKFKYISIKNIQTLFSEERLLKWNH